MDRYSGIGDARVDIQKVLSDPSVVYSQSVQTVKHRKKLQVGIPWIAATAILCLIIAGAAVWMLKPGASRDNSPCDFIPLYPGVDEPGRERGVAQRSFELVPYSRNFPRWNKSGFCGFD